MQLLTKLFKISIVPVFLFSSVDFSYAKTNTRESALVKKAILASQACYHWAGEVGDQTPERNREIEAGVTRDCPPAKKLMEKVFARYPKNKELYEHVLYLHELGQMNLTKVEMKRLCKLVKKGAGC